ncbi:putative membrane protein [Streptomyces davaonensis JCM 4913]|uniref:Putative membrane protein n=1 Tax=Streptomyces davaonensis (strain DSM 101723 / JCM 4913 / KCC S-0913 / 768) TaxID=1214101 RepID=K4R8K4_STRDJ|nr:hypothetical protein [Streptomyces davaonensis]CCK29365.1 putative membrane protein [Streptomyces davaonensis JCM 4913]
MGWGNGPKDRENYRLRELYAAAAVAAGQIPPIWLAWWIADMSGDTYGRGFNSLGIACVLIFAPLVLPVLGLVQAMVQAVPAARLAGLVAAHTRGPRWAWHVLCSVLLGVGWAALTTALWDWPFLTNALLFGGVGILPAFAMTYVHSRPRWGFWGIWLSSGLASFALFVLVGIGGAAASAAGLIKGYEPPVLSAAQVTGVWRGADGAVLRLHPDGRAELTELPTETSIDDWTDDRQFAVCDGTGTWSLEREDTNWDRDGVALRPADGCGLDTYWVIGGTESEPELFVLFGDPDAGELWILERQRPS